METPTITEVPEGDSTTAVRLGATRRTPSIRWKATAYSLLGALAFLLVWQLASGYTRTEFNLLPSPRAVFEQMRAGRNDDEIKRYLTDRYSDFVLYDPPLRGGTALLWFGPLAVLVIGGFVLARIIRRRAAVARTETNAAPEDEWT